ncbi:RIIa domain-containing protein 1 [Acropora cervicornis]|uniref:RIIa domain-containing protein 1 n=1 Tax=Acropora cervicornis TaxID=6130 RepID=A0AAD9VB44_ACRCE|nr:RIIa domain-containing protein 1 [Acropora cervicornis]
MLKCRSLTTCSLEGVSKWKLKQMCRSTKVPFFCFLFSYGHLQAVNRTHLHWQWENTHHNHGNSCFDEGEVGKEREHCNHDGELTEIYGTFYLPYTASPEKRAGAQNSKQSVKASREPPLKIYLSKMEEKSKKMFGINGMEQNDTGALTPEQQQKLNEFKISTRFANERYLREHPEVSCLLNGFLGSILLERPENVREFASSEFLNKLYSVLCFTKIHTSAKYFSDPELRRKVELQVTELNNRIKRTNKPYFRNRTETSVWMKIGYNE